ncbi:uncharacterized protein LOC144124593 isoform X1 [Amblyomma americanum]
MLGQPKQKSKEEDARKKRDRHKTGGGSAQCTVSAQSEQVIAVASHIMTRVGNQTDSDGGIDLPPVASLPVIRLLQPMVDGAGNEELHYAEDDWEPPLVDEPQSPAAAVGKSGATPEAIEQESNLFFPAVQPADASSTAAAGCSSATVASGAAAGPTTAEAVATGDAGRAPRGWMALLERSLADENDYRAALLREEHGLRLQLMREDHNSILKERQEKNLLDIPKKNWNWKS